MPDPVPPNAPQQESGLSFDFAPDPAAPRARGTSAAADASAGASGNHAPFSSDTTGTGSGGTHASLSAGTAGAGANGTRAPLSAANAGGGASGSPVSFGSDAAGLDGAGLLAADTSFGSGADRGSGYATDFAAPASSAAGPGSGYAADFVTPSGSGPGSAFGSSAVPGSATAGTTRNAPSANFDPITGEPVHSAAPATAAATAASAAAQAKPRAAPRTGSANGNGSSNGDTPRTRARAAAAGSAEPPGMDPERLRLIGLLSVLALIILGFGYYYWQAVMAPGAGSRLPPVAMPPPGATGATNAVQIVGPTGATDPAALGNGVDAAGGDPSGGDPSVAGMLAPSPMGGMSRATRDDLERRLERTEHELAATQQAIQAQANMPRQERLPPVAAPDNTDIRVARTVQPARIAPALENAYELLRTGDLATAQQQYETALRQDPNSRDALLGMATVAARQNQGAQASSYYLRLLELDPNDATAVAGLVGLSGGDTGQNERRLKAILTSNPDAGPVLFALGNLYAQQGRWPEAQQTYFRAYTAAPDNADYAYNLAIGLDRLNQGKLALTYYQRALALGQDKPAGFDRTALRQRMHELNGAH
ncbi:tetratricopeptide repeat protein [Duganella sp. FT27W]|nr:tetratricopeptide repeat protein [Duganella sp. FT27W]